jgi:hypothetical protein
MMLAPKQKNRGVCPRKIIKVSDQAIVDRCLKVIGGEDEKICIDTKCLGKVPELLYVRACRRAYNHTYEHTINELQRV